MKRKVAQLAVTAVAMLGFGLITVGPASADSAVCESWGGVCTSGSIASNGNHEVCFSGKHKALAYWGRAELWDADTGVMVGSFATNAYDNKSRCVGGLYGQHYYERGTGGYFYGTVWN